MTDRQAARAARQHQRATAKFLRLEHKRPDAVVVLGCGAISQGNGNAQMRTFTSYRYGYTDRMGRTRQWFYCERRWSPYGFQDYVHVELFDNEPAAENAWRSRLTRNLSDRLPELVRSVQVGGFPAPTSRRAEWRTVLAPAEITRRTLDELTAIYSALTGLPMDAARSCLLAGIPPEEVHANTKGDPTPEQVQSYACLAALRAPVPVSPAVTR